MTGGQEDRWTGGQESQTGWSCHPVVRSSCRPHARIFATTPAPTVATFPNGEPEPFVHRDRRDQLDRHLHVVPRHHHLHPFRQLHASRHVRRPEVELRPVPLEERRVSPALLL